jgi:hypothetical protein
MTISLCRERMPVRRVARWVTLALCAAAAIALLEAAPALAAESGSEDSFFARTLLPLSLAVIMVSHRAEALPDPAGSGWGLALVDRLSDRWGVSREDSTCVWFEIDRVLSGRTWPAYSPRWVPAPRRRRRIFQLTGQ